MIASREEQMWRGYVMSKCEGKVSVHQSWRPNLKSDNNSSDLWDNSLHTDNTR